MTFDIPFGDTTLPFTVCDTPPKWVKEYGRVRDWLLAANDCGDGRHTEDELITFLHTTQYVMFTTPNAAAVIEIHVSHGGRKDLFVFLAGGNLEEITAAEPAIAGFARAQGCSHMQVLGRAGWQRALKQLDYQFVSSTLIKKL